METKEGVTSVELTQSERQFLLELFASSEKELLGELGRTETRDYKKKLEEKLMLLERLRTRINV
jgi:hypothetical protein